jgi:hypothetical protein
VRVFEKKGRRRGRIIKEKQKQDLRKIIINRIKRYYKNINSKTLE